VTGFLKIDSNGDRETDFSLWDMNPETGAFRVSLCTQKTKNNLSSTYPINTALLGHLLILWSPCVPGYL
jgi:hypothetical protein